MKEILIGIASGTVAALGMGGGTVLILLLGLFSNLNQHLIQGTNLIFFIPTSITAIYMNIKNKTINYKKAGIIIISGIIGAILGSNLSFKFKSNSLKKYFGIFLLCIAAFEIYSLLKQYRKKKKENNK
ncbi:MAG: sulfite exporter TauE/SafE family protein [Clostridia bacterium]|nr:sulfite exporter TauE/SafE family protein [Clostridia bacterium]